jgi:hypothetical protein
VKNRLDITTTDPYIQNYLHILRQDPFNLNQFTLSVTGDLGYTFGEIYKFTDDGTTLKGDWHHQIIKNPSCPGWLHIAGEQDYDPDNVHMYQTGMHCLSSYYGKRVTKLVKATGVRVWSKIARYNEAQP